MQHPLAGRIGVPGSPRPATPVRSVSSVNARNRRRAGSSASATSGTSLLRVDSKPSLRTSSSRLLETSISSETSAASSATVSVPGEQGDQRGVDTGEKDAPKVVDDLPVRIRTDQLPRLGGTPAARNVPRHLMDLATSDQALLNAELDLMDEDELTRFLASLAGSPYSGPKRLILSELDTTDKDLTSTPRVEAVAADEDDRLANSLATPRPPPRRSLTTSSSTSLPIFPSSPSSAASSSAKPYTLLGSPHIPPISNSPSPRLRLPHRQSSMNLLTLTKAPDGSVLFPPSPPAHGLFIDRAGGLDFSAAGRVDDGARVAVRALSRMARGLRHISVELERENYALKAELSASRPSEGGVPDGMATIRPNRGSLSSARSLLLRQDDQRSINDSLNEALSTSLGAEFPDQSDVASSKTPRSRAASTASTLGFNGQGDSHKLNGKLVRGRGEGQDATTILHHEASVPAPNHASSPSIRVRQVDKVSQAKPDRGGARTSWTSGLWAWNASVSTPEKHRPRASSRSTSISGLASPGNERVEFEPAPSRPSVSAQRDSGPFLIGDEEEAEGDWQAHESSPAFKAIVLATRVMTPDPSSVLQKPLPASSLVAYLAHNLVSQARDDGVRIKRSSRRASISHSHRSRDPPVALINPSLARRPAQTVTTSISNAISNSLGAVSAAIGTQERPQKAAPGSSSAARKALLRTLSSKVPQAPPMETADDAEDIAELRVSSVELNALIAPENRPPTMLLRRATLTRNRSTPGALMKVATQFATSDILDYTDRYGFVYDMRYVRMLLDLKAAAAEIPQDTPLEEIDREFFAMRSGMTPQSEHRRQSEDVVKVFVSPDTSPPLDDVDRLAEPAVRTRANTIASFQPSPVKTIATSQDAHVSARGSVDLQSRVPSGNWRTYSGSIQIKANNLEKLATLNRKPISSLLSQLSEVHDRQEVERQKAWQAFVKDRQYKTRKAHGRKATISLDAWSSVTHVLNPSRSKLFVDDQKWQGASLGISQMGIGKSGSDDIKRFHDLVRETGIPIVLRPSVWWECTGAMDAFVPGEYQEILSIHAMDEHPVLGEIEKDVGRTFPTNVFFGGDGVGCRKLRRLLTAYAWHDPSIGYCQGMNLLAATLLLTYDDEEKAYWTLLCLVKNLLPEDWFTSDLTGSMTEQAVLSQYLNSLLPDVAKHLSELGLEELSSLTFGWLLSVFTSCLPINTLLRVWDCFIVCGKDTIVRMAMAILSLAKDDILACESAADVFECLNGMTEKMWGADKLIHIEKQLQTSMKSEEIAGKRTMHLRMLALNSGDGEVDLLA